MTILRPELSLAWIFPARDQADLMREVSNFNRCRTCRLSDIKSSESETGDFFRTFRRRKTSSSMERRTKRTIIEGGCCFLTEVDDADVEPFASCEVLFLFFVLRTCATSMFAAVMTRSLVVFSDELINLTTVSTQSLPVEIERP